MSAIRPLFQLTTLNIKKASKYEIIILEAELFLRIHDALKNNIRKENKEYFRILKLDEEKENAMLEVNFLRCIINDILSSEEYSLPGIAYYTDTPEDIVYEIASGQNIRPTFIFAKKIIELHRSVRPYLYREVINKIMREIEEELAE